MKSCFKCGVEKPLTDFYKHKGMADGHVNKCKPCNKADVIQNRLLKVDKYREYDRKRGARQSPEYLKDYREKYPNKYKAHCAVGYAIKRGSLVNPNSCEKCGESKTIAHHADYLKPLDVEWLCQGCHVQWHAENGEGLNG